MSGWNPILCAVTFCCRGLPEGVYFPHSVANVQVLSTIAYLIRRVLKEEESICRLLAILK